MVDLLGSLYILIPLSVLLVFAIGAIFWWSVRSGQFDDLEGPAYRLLMDDRDPPVAEPEREKPAAGEDDAQQGGRH
ncbi:cbb3-type cytochrome oxidase assembly protein CcoS [Pseudothauera rhizosphaerae]|uniref:Cbb3-type cytochrome oxidase assembly protein CcoS n=1 Tax=Pseudothauera rhizosphaerae TaxID=2565932 RepID=A0A4S4AXN4_9RHOO|nr:cbb3-type cytochrome oxidase assembly protein CcoS [Pseudothauera rhizosphaerae]THF64393.1 cbb3-type cytochrome oxidase assembly protein CcoS [Pseudothauera rhizosphaerae]